MSDYRKQYREAEREAYWTAPRLILALVVLTLALGSIGWIIGIISQPARILSKTLDADNVIQNYEWFHDANGNFMARSAQVRQFKQLGAQETDAQEKGRLRIEMAAIQQSCRELARRYNANATKVNRSIFRGQSAPEMLNAGECE